MPYETTTSRGAASHHDRIYTGKNSPHWLGYYPLPACRPTAKKLFPYTQGKVASEECQPQGLTMSCLRVSSVSCVGVSLRQWAESSKEVIEMQPMLFNSSVWGAMEAWAERKGGQHRQQAGRLGFTSWRRRTRPSTVVTYDFPCCGGPLIPFS